VVTYGDNFQILIIYHNKPKNLFYLVYCKSMVSKTKPKILAFRRDSKGKKQYTYDPVFIETQSKKKYAKVIQKHSLFCKIKSEIMKNIYSKNIQSKEIAIILYLMIHCGFRIGNHIYEKNNKSYGITTIQFHHLKFTKGVVLFDFIGKKGIRNQSSCAHKEIYRYLYSKRKVCKDNDSVFPGITSHIVNNYLRTFDKDISSKDLRTWTANLLFIEYAIIASKKGNKNPIKSSIENVSERLHNTTNVCKKNYIDTKIIHLIEQKLKNDDIK